MTEVFALEQAFSKPTNPSCFCLYNSHTKMNFSKHFPMFSSDKMTLCNNDDQTWFSDLLTSLKISPFMLGFQHHPRGPVVVIA